MAQIKSAGRRKPPLLTRFSGWNCGANGSRLIKATAPALDGGDEENLGISKLVMESTATMVFEHIEELKRAYTDKYVVVDASRPDLKRFEGFTGTVKTVNMSGKALVQFDAYDNIGWFDIDVDYLKIIDKPLPKAETKEKEPKQAAAKKKTPAPATGKQPAGKMSVEEMLAAARGQKSAESKKPAAAAAAPAAPKPTAMSTADILAAARAGKPAATAAAAESPATAPATSPPTSASLAEESPAAEPAAQAAVAESTPRGELPTTVSEIVAFCRERDRH